jgi:hypothetical protein
MPAGDVFATIISVPANTYGVFQPASGVEILITWVNVGVTGGFYDYNGVNAISSTTGDIYTIKPYFTTSTMQYRNIYQNLPKLFVNNSVYLQFPSSTSAYVVCLRGIRTK